MERQERQFALARLGRGKQPRKTPQQYLSSGHAKLWTLVRRFLMRHRRKEIVFTTGACLWDTSVSDADISVASMQWIFWDDPINFVGRRVSVLQGHIKYTGPQQCNKLSFKADLECGKARFIVKDTGGIMVKAKSRFREPMVPQMLRLHLILDACGGLRMEGILVVRKQRITRPIR